MEVMFSGYLIMAMFQIVVLDRVRDFCYNSLPCILQWQPPRSIRIQNSEPKNYCLEGSHF